MPVFAWDSALVFVRKLPTSGFRRTNPRQRLHERNAVVIRFVDHGSKAFSLKVIHHGEQDELLRPPECT